MYSKSASALSLTYTNTTRGSESSINNNNKQTVPDLSHLSEAERKIISSVLERQRAEEEQCNDLLSSHTSFKTTTTTSTATSNSFNRNVFIRNLEESEFDQIKTVASPSQITTASSKNTNTQQIKYSTLPHTTASHLKKQEQEELKSSNLHQCHSISDIANETKQRYGSIDTGNSCDLCKKTKFTSSGAGHICFHCKLRCCVRCAFKYQSKNKQIWTCVECKKKQDTLLRSGKWFSESTNLNKKNFTSDYILNKGVNLNTNIRENSKNSSILNTDTTGRPDVIQQTTSNIMSSNTIDTNSAIKPPSRRVLPTITKQKSVQLKSAKDNEDDDYDDLSKRQILTRNAQINSNSNETNTITTNSARSSINDNSNSSKRSLRQPLIKQISLNNPPTYLNRSTANNNNNNNQDDEFSLYNSSNNNPSLVKQTFTSNQDLGNTLLLSNNLNEQSNSSQNSSINNINRRSSANRERLQDPQQMLKAFKSSNPNSRLNSITNLSSLQQQQAQEDDLYQTRHVNETILEQVSSKLVTDTNTNITTNKPAMRRLLPTSNPVQRAKQLLMQPTDSLSSDPSDYQQTRQIEFKSNLEEMSRKQSKTKRNTRSRKQPSIPVNAASGSVSTTAAISTTIPTTTSTISNLPTQQQLIQKTLMKHNLKQHSLTSSDDDLINMASQGNKRNKNDFSMPDPEEEEDNFNDDDVDEEIRSTTEISTNDEMDLESGSVSINNINKNRVNIINSNKNNATINIKPVRNLSSLTTSNLITHQSKTIDDYLVQNLKKEEILAAKMSKFLSPTNWQLSSDGKKMIGHIILKYDPNLANFSSTSTVDSSVEFNTSSSLGLKIVGGRANPLEPTQLCAYVSKVKKDSIGDSVGGLQLGDEVVKWNGKLLRGLTFDEVYSFISKSRPDNQQVELIVERLIDDSDRIKIKNSLWNNESANNADLKIPQQHQLEQELFTNSKIDSNKSIGKIQLKIFHDSIERILYINVLNLSINYCNYNEQTTLETTNDYYNYNYNSTSNNNNSNVSNKNEVVESIYCILHLLLKKRNIDQFKKISKVCNLDKTTGLYLINEAFTFEPVNSIDLHDLNIDLQAINYLTKQPLGKLNIEYSEEMFDNQFLNLNMLPINSNNQTNLNKTLQQQSHLSQTTTPDNANANQSNSRRRQLPQIPPPVDNRSDKGSVDLTDKTRRSKLSDSDAVMAISNNSNTNQFNEQSSLFVNSQQQQQPPLPVQPIKMRNMLLPKQYSDKSDYSNENDDTLFTNSTKPTFQAQDQPTIPKRQQPVVPLVRSRIRDASQTSRSPINVNDDQKLYGQQQETAQFNSPNYRSGINTNANLNGDNNNTTINENLTGKHLPTIAQTTNNLNYRSPSPPSPPPTITTKPSGQRQLPQPIKVRQPPQLQQQNINNPYLPQEWPDADIPSSTINKTSNQFSNNNNKIPDRLIEKSLLLDLKTKTSDLYASNSTNNNISTGLLSQSPDNNFINTNNKISNRNSSIQSPFKQNSFDYPSEFSKTNTLDSQQQSNNAPGTMPRRAEKLFSAKHLNQRFGVHGNNLNATSTAIQPCAVHGYVRNGIEFDSDGSEHSQFSNVSKLSSNSVKSAQSELLKGATNNLNNTNRRNTKLPTTTTTTNTTDNRLLPQSQLPVSPQQQQQQMQEPNTRLLNQDNQDLLLSNNFNQDLSDWNAKPSVNDSILQQQQQQQPLLDQNIIKPTPATTQSPPPQQHIDQLNQEAFSSTIKQSKEKTINNTTNSNNTATTTTPTATTNTLIKSTNNIPVPSYIKSKDNPTFDFFAQFSTPVKQTSKNNSTMSLPGQSMQQTTINNTTITKETDGTLSDSALTNPNSPPETGGPGGNKKRRPSMAKALVILGLSKKSNSASNLTLGKRYGFARSEEIGVAPELRNIKLNTSSGQGDQSSTESNQPKPRLWSGALKLPHEVPFNDFIDGLGPGQKISRQALGLSCLGEVKMALFLDRQKLNIEIQQAKNLKIKIGYRVMPISVYIKLYLFNGTSCVEKQKTTTKRRTLNPTFQETLKFETNYRGTILQITCWGDYGKFDRKVFMGVAQIALDELNLSNTITGWYKLYPVNSIVTDFSTLTPATDLCETESGYSLSSK